MPVVQDAAALAKLHALPQVPQLLVVSRRVSQPSVLLWLQSSKPSSSRLGGQHGLKALAEGCTPLSQL